METLREKLLRTEVENLSKSFELISGELVVLQEFITAEFGKKYEKFCVAKSSMKNEADQHQRTQVSSAGHSKGSMKIMNPSRQNLKRAGDSSWSQFGSSSKRRSLRTAKRVELEESKQVDSPASPVVFDVLGGEDFVGDKLVTSEAELDSDDEHEEESWGGAAEFFVKDERMSSDEEDDPDYADDDDDDPSDPSYDPLFTPESDGFDVAATTEGKLDVTMTMKGKSMVMLDGYLYVYQGESSTTKSWRCQRLKNRKCAARIHTTKDFSDLHLVRRTSEGHSHPPVPGAILYRTTIEKLKTAALDNPTLSSTEVVNSILSTVDADDRSQLPPPQSLQRVVRSYRLNHGVRNPRTNPEDKETRRPEPIEPLEEAISVQVTESLQGKPRIAVDGWVYQFQNESKDKLLWRCEWHRGRGKEKIPCYVRVHTSRDLKNNPCIIASTRLEHNHPPRSLASDIFRRKCKSTYEFLQEEAVRNPLWSATQLIEAAMERLSEEEKALLPKVETLRRHVSRSRKVAGISNKALGGNVKSKKKSTC